MTLSFILESSLSFLLAATLIYCIVLERRLAAVRKGQEGLKTMIGELNAAISGAGASLRALKSAASGAAETLDERLRRARLLADELALLTASGLQGTQSPRRATRTLDVCLAVVGGAYLANRYDGHVILAKTFNDLMGEFELADASGGTVRIESVGVSSRAAALPIRHAAAKPSSWRWVVNGMLPTASSSSIRNLFPGKKTSSFP